MIKIRLKEVILLSVAFGRVFAANCDDMCVLV